MAEASTRIDPRHWRAALLLTVFVAYIACIWLANTTREGFDNVIMIWMPGGVALAALVTLGRHNWPLIALADLCGHLLFAANPTPYVFMPFSMVTNTLGALAGATLVLRILGPAGVAFSQRTCIAVVAGSLMVAISSAPLGVAGLVYSGISPAEAYFPAIAKWIAADLFGALLITPALTLIYGRWQQRREQLLDDGDARWPEYAGWLLLLLACAVVLLWLRPDAPQFELGFTGAPLALLIWSAMRFPPLPTAAASLLTGVGSILAVGNDLLGLPSPQTHPDSLVLLFFLCTLAVVPLFLAAAQYERRRAAQLLLVAKQELERRVVERTADLQSSNDRLSHTVAELRDTQQSLIEHEKLAALGGLVAGIAHEVNTPVGVATTSATHLAGATAQLRRRLEGGRLTRTELTEFLDLSDEAAGLVERNLRRAADLVASFKQIAVDQSTQERRHFELQPFLSEVLHSLQTLHRDAAFELRCADRLMLHSYPGPLFQVLGNLIGNAVQHGSADGRHAEVVVTAEPIGDDGLQLTVRDHGSGMPAEVARRVFEPFFTTQRGRGGTGLGLHIVYNLVTGVLGGRIALTTAPGEGSEFRIELPLAPETVREPQLADAAAAR